MTTVSIEEFKGYVGKEIGLSDWFEIDQDRVNAFAQCTEDRQYIHVDVEAAKQGPFGGTIAHGFLTLSLLSYFGFQNEIVPAGVKTVVNYGLNKVRFLSPVRVGSSIRNRAVLKEVADKGEGRVLMTVENTVEIQGEERAAMIAETLTLMVF